MVTLNCLGLFLLPIHICESNLWHRFLLLWSVIIENGFWPYKMKMGRQKQRVNKLLSNANGHASLSFEQEGGCLKAIGVRCCGKFEKSGGLPKKCGFYR
jgi:hypothetical protein